MTKKQQGLLFAMSYIGWFGCVFSPKYGLSAWSYLIPIFYFIVYRRFQRITRAHGIVFCVSLIVGLIFDNISLQMGWIKLLHAHEGPGLPHWLNSLWLLFAFSIPLYGNWLLGRWLFVGFLGLVIGPLTYFSGAGFGVLQIDQRSHLLIYALFWGLYFPASLWFYARQIKLLPPKKI